MKTSLAIVTGGKVIGAGVLLLGAVLMLYFADPSHCRLFPPCPIYFATGLYCPGCGATRALHCLVHGDLGGAMRMNVLVLIAIPFIVLLCLRPALSRRPAVPKIILAILFGYAVLRNLSVYPFILLAPH